MTGEDIFVLIIMLMVSFGIGAACFALGAAAEKSSKPFGFWTWKEVKPQDITDIPAYNRENGTLWKLYSVPCFLSGCCAVLGIWIPRCSILSVILLVLDCTVGILWLIWRYQRIFRKYSTK